ncbi:MAG: UDP glycosyltransferase [Actinomycetota bacterium]|nr:UDP glycosyltransferase [Actinomycetota bacterium]
MHLLMAGVTAPSHIYPSLALITELVSRGHRVSYVVGDRLAELVTPTGAGVIEHPSILPDSDTAWPDDPGEAMQLFLDEAIAALPRVLESDRPDAVLYDIGGLAGPVAAHHWDVPAIQLSPTYVKWEGYDEEMAEFFRELKASPSGRRYYSTVRSWLDANGIARETDSFLGEPEECVALMPRRLQPNADHVDPRIRFTGPCIDESRFTGWSPQPGDSRPLVYVALGTAYTDEPEFYRACIEALSPGFRLVMSTGKVDPDSLGDLPHGVVAARTQPQLDVLRHASVFITHAGMGSAAESLWFGVPTVAVPQAVDQFTNAAQLEQSGSGVHLPKEEVNPDSLLAAVRTASGLAGRAAELRTEVRQHGGVGASADEIERLANQS